MAMAATAAEARDVNVLSCWYVPFFCFYFIYFTINYFRFTQHTKTVMAAAVAVVAGA